LPAHFVCVVELIPESYVAPLNLEAIFGRIAPLQVDLGCGDGSFVSALAKQIPDHNFLGIERLAGRVRATARKAEQIGNLRVLRVETAYAVRYLLPAGSVTVFHLLFPDPWPKRRHQCRRVVTAEFLHTIASALAENGSLRIATDQLDYFEQIGLLLQQSIEFAIAPAGGMNHLPQSTFERRFTGSGAEIYRLDLRKISPLA
jgi:tRNA (guanine-N7-)-methyltransferase